MARSLGSLVVSLGLSTAEFTAGLTKSEREAQKFARAIDKGIASAVNVATIALGALTTAAAAGFVAIDQLAKQAGNFKDLEETTGASAEALASFSVAAQVAGSDVATVGDAMNKLAKNLTGVDDESKAAGAALKALGIPIEEFKSLDPAAQMEALAKAFGRFQDGAGKSAGAMALLGKSGAQLLPFFKELASGAGRVTILNQALIEQADKYADAQAKARAELNLWAQVVATKTLPAITALTGGFTDYIKMLAGVDSTMNALAASKNIEEWAERLIKKVGFVVDVFEALSRLVEMVNAGGFFSKEGQEVLMRPTFGSLLEKKFAEMKAEEAQRAREDRGFKPPGRLLDFSGAQAGGKGASDKISEGERLIESLQKQLEGTQDLTVAEKVLLDVSLGRIKDVTHAQVDQALAIAQQIDAIKAAKQADEDWRKEQEAISRAMDETARNIEHSINASKQEAQQVKDGNDAIREQIAFLTGGEEAVRKMTDARLADTIAEQQRALAIEAGLGATKGQLDAMKETIDLLKQRQGVLKELDIAKKFAEEAKALQDVKNAISDSFANAFTDFITGTKSAKDAFKSFTNDLVAQISRVAAQNIANALFGGKNSAGPDIFGVLAKLALTYFTGTPAAAGLPASSSGGGFGEHFAMGGTTRGGAAWVGEHGKELAVFPRGTKITANHDLRRLGGTNVTNNMVINVPRGADSATLRQSAKRAFAMAASAMRRG